MTPRPRLLVFVVAYNAENTIESVLTRVPPALASDYDVEVLIIDDSSADATFDKGRRATGIVPFKVRVLRNPINQGYGGNQKIGYHYAIQNGFDFVALIHGDGQYAPERLPDLLAPLADGRAAAVFGSRMMSAGSARQGGMPLYKYVGNKVLTWFENKLLRTSLSEFHSGYRVYRVEALRRIPFHLNTRDFHFDTEIIIQLVSAGLPIVEVPIPTYYGDEISHVNGLAYAWHVACAVVRARLQGMGLLYDRKFDSVQPATSNAHYVLKLGYPSSHTVAMESVKPGERVVDLGCAGGLFAAELRALRSCWVAGVDRGPLAPGVALDEFLRHDLDQGPPTIDYEGVDVVLMLDVLEHLHSPEDFVHALARLLTPRARIIVTSGNVAFFVTRAMLLLGSFNYGKRGILDLTHHRLFTFASLRALFEQAGFEAVRVQGIPAPYPLALGDHALSRGLLRINGALINLSRGLFAYQMLYEFRANPSLESLLRAAERSAADC
jgi:glycosyltransferase involved in cell wall biosynthesis/2-polyprenyl-3-methyl-5-hydroxy-6-metoxy-1,4-benzoquinol methylase